MDGAEDAEDAQVRAYVDAGALGTAGDSSTVRFRRALVYRDGSLL